MVRGPWDCINRCVLEILRHGHEEVMKFGLWEKSKELMKKIRKKGSIAMCVEA